jgi:hypothetical protein
VNTFDRVRRGFPGRLRSFGDDVVVDDEDVATPVNRHERGLRVGYDDLRQDPRQHAHEDDGRSGQVVLGD